MNYWPRKAAFRIYSKPVSEWVALVENEPEEWRDWIKFYLKDWAVREQMRNRGRGRFRKTKPKKKKTNA